MKRLPVRDRTDRFLTACRLKVTHESPCSTASKGIPIALRGDGSFQRGFQAKSDARTTPAARLDNEALRTLNVQRSSDPMILENSRLARTGHRMPHLEIWKSEDIRRRDAGSVSGLSRWLKAVARWLEPLAWILSTVVYQRISHTSNERGALGLGNCSRVDTKCSLGRTQVALHEVYLLCRREWWSVGEKCKPR